MPLLLPDQAAIRARLAGRSYWRLRYTDGRTVNEWDCDWSLAPLTGRQALRLYCPNGQVAELGNSGDASGKLFQLKGAIVTAGAGRNTLYQLIGIVTDTAGNCDCAAWEYGAQRLRTFKDNVYRMKYEHIGVLSFEVLGLAL